MKAITVEILKERLQRSTWLPLAIMSLIFLVAMAVTLQQQHQKELNQMRSTLGDLIRSQQTQITQEVLLGQDEGVKLRIEAILSHWTEKYPNVQACFSFKIWPANMDVREMVSCSKKTQYEPALVPDAKEQVLYINVGNKKLAELHYSVLRLTTIFDWFPPTLIAALLLGLVVALLTHFTLVKRVEKKVLSPLLLKLAQDERMAAIAQTAQMLAHDIRKPFSLVQLALLRLQDSSNDEVRKFGESISPEIERSLRSIDSMLRDILDVNRQMRPVLSPFLVRTLMERVRDAIDKLHPESEIAISYHFDEGLTLLADLEQLERVLINLIENAFVALGSRGEIDVEITETPQMETPSTLGSVEFKVSNRGPLISKEEQEKLFLPFFTSRKNGTGLGLHIAKKIVNQHGGDIRCVSTREEGTNFIFSIPNRNEDGASAHSTFGTSKQGSILVFDDDSLVRDHWRERLTDCGKQQVFDYSSWEEFVANDGFNLADENAIAFVDIHYEKSRHSGLDIAKSLRQIGVRQIYAITSDEYTAKRSRLFNEVFGKRAPDTLKQLVG